MYIIMPLFILFKNYFNEQDMCQYLKALSAEFSWTAIG